MTKHPTTPLPIEELWPKNKIVYINKNRKNSPINVFLTKYNFLNNLEKPSFSQIQMLNEMKKQLASTTTTYETNTIVGLMNSNNNSFESVLEKLHSLELKNWDLTLPTTNYFGPGTRLSEKLNTEPVGPIDAIAREHDWQYLLANDSSDIIKADQTMLSAMSQLTGLDNKLPYALTKLAFNLKNTFYDNDRFVSNLSSEEKQMLSDYYKNSSSQSLKMEYRPTIHEG